VVPRPILILVNAIYFKGNWAAQFDVADTEDGAFWLAPGEAVGVPLMTQKADFGYGRWDGLQVLELSYKGNDLSMVVLLPDQVNGLPGLEAALTPESLARWTGRLRPMEVQVILPRFKLTGEFELGGILAAMGMPDACDAAAADFSGMNGRPHDLFINKVVHKAFVEVNEEGTEAAAAPAVVALRAMSMSPVFRADHPFLFLIRDNATGSILFLGRVADPSAADA
jgi:serpin B